MYLAGQTLGQDVGSCKPYKKAPGAGRGQVLVGTDLNANQVGRYIGGGDGNYYRN